MGNRKLAAYLLKCEKRNWGLMKGECLLSLRRRSDWLFMAGVERCRKVSDSESLTQGFFGS
jgi:hypothetical protein